MSKPILASLALAVIAFLPAPSRASYAIFVGSHLTADGSTFLGGTGDEPSSHWLEIVPERNWPDGSLIQVGVDRRATYPGELMEIPQAPRTARYISMNYSEYAGFPAPLTNGGLNEYGVAARDVWSPSRPELQKMTPNPQHGLNYSDLSRIAMERAHSAREAVEIVGGLIDKYGYATYGGNSHFFADAKEGWVLIDFAGGQRLWIAERVGPDEVRMSYPGYIEDSPARFPASSGALARIFQLHLVCREPGMVRRSLRSALQRESGVPKRERALADRSRVGAAPAGESVRMRRSRCATCWTRCAIRSYPATRTVTAR